MRASRVGIVVGLVLTGAVGLAGLATAAGWGPWLVGLAVASGWWPVARAWSATRGTALRPAVAWAALALGLGVAACVRGGFEPAMTGRPWAGHWAYLSILAGLAASISVLNARRPGGGAWAILMGLLVLIFVLPWAEGTGLAGRFGAWNRLRLEAPWSIFYALVVVAGVTNYLPTRSGPVAVVAGLGFAAMGLGLTQTDWPQTVRGKIWLGSPLCLSLAAWLAWARWDAGCGRPGVEALWLWFRDHWGVVWALRVQERFNRAAEASRWPIRLSWHGPIPAPGVEGEPDMPAAAAATLSTLLRRFADVGRLDAAARCGDGPCDSGRVPES